MKLLLHAAAKLIAGFMLLVVLLFWPAGTWCFWNAWLLCGALFAPMIAVGLLLWKKAPQLLKKRLNGREQQAAQKLAVALSGAVFIGVFVAAGLDFRLRFTRLPAWLSVAALVPFLLGYLLYAETMRENAWLSRSVEVQQGQKLVDTGLYGVAPPHVYGHLTPVLRHAADSGLRHRLCSLAAVCTDFCAAHPKRGIHAARRAGWL